MSESFTNASPYTVGLDLLSPGLGSVSLAVNACLTTNSTVAFVPTASVDTLAVVSPIWDETTEEGEAIP